MKKGHCPLERHNIKTVDYRDVEFLKQFLTPHGSILPSARTGCCAKNQKKIEKAIKRARTMALLPYVF